MNSMDHQNYSNYVLKMEQINTDRQKDGLQPAHVMTFDEWRGKSEVLP
jgi:hypothetical protein